MFQTDQPVLEIDSSRTGSKHPSGPEPEVSPAERGWSPGTPHEPSRLAASGFRNRPAALRQVQRAYGNRYSQRLLAHLSSDRPGPSQSQSIVPPTTSHGQALAEPSKSFMEKSFGAGFNDVRLHTDSEAAESAESIGANAYTAGRDIYFARGMYSPSSRGGQRLLAHELAHTLQRSSPEILHASPSHSTLPVCSAGDPLEYEADRAAEDVLAGHTPALGRSRGEASRNSCGPSDERLADIDRQLQSVIITGEYRQQLERERDQILNRASGLFPGLAPSPDAQPIPVVVMSDEDYEAMTGLPASALPDAPSPDAMDQDLPPGWPSAIPGSIGTGSVFTPRPNWYYRVLTANNPPVADILGGADLLPRLPDPGFSFQPAANPAEMTFRHMRASGNVPQVGTDRISTSADLEAFQTILRDRGTGELVRVDVDAARRLGAEFLENGEIMGHLDTIESDLVQQLEAARLAGRGKNFISRLEGRLNSCRAAQDYARTFNEGHGVSRIPSESISEVPGPNLAEAVEGEMGFLRNLRFFRYGGRVLLVVGLAMSGARIATAPEGQRGRVISQEAGGWVFSFAGAAAGAKAGAAFGAALGIETGPGAVVTAAIGALIGGAIGFFGGQAAGDALYDVGANAAKHFEDMPSSMDVMVQVVGTPQERRDYKKMKEVTGMEPPSPFPGGF